MNKPRIIHKVFYGHKPKWPQVARLMVLHILRIWEAVVFILSLGYFSSDLQAHWLFSDWYDVD